MRLDEQVWVEPVARFGSYIQTLALLAHAVISEIGGCFDGWGLATVRDFSRPGSSAELAQSMLGKVCGKLFFVSGEMGWDLKIDQGCQSRSVVASDSLIC